MKKPSLQTTQTVSSKLLHSERDLLPVDSSTLSHPATLCIITRRVAVVSTVGGSLQLSEKKQNVETLENKDIQVMQVINASPGVHIRYMQCTYMA